LARYVATNPHLIRNKNVLELGSGCGLTGLVAGAVGATSVVQTDFNDAVLLNLQNNVVLNDLILTVSVAKLDFDLQRGCSVSDGWLDGCGENREPVCVVLAADVICKPSDSVAVSKSIFDCLIPGGKAFVLCANAKHRFGVDIFESECLKVGLELTITLLDDIYGGELLKGGGLEKTSGYVEGMEFTLFELIKPFESVLLS